MNEKKVKSPFWEKQKKEKRKNSLVRWLVLTILLILLVNAVLKIPSFLNSLSTPFSKDPYDEATNSSFDFSFRSNLLLITTQDGVLFDVALLSIEGGGKQTSGLVFALSENQPLRSQFKQAYSKKGAVGVKNLLRNSLFVPIDRYIVWNEGGEINKEFLLEQKKKATGLWALAIYFLEKKELNSKIQTNISTSEGWNLFWSLRGTKFGEKDTKTLAEVNVSSLPSAEVSSLLENFFLDQSILDEGGSVSIKNSSGVEGLGSSLANLVTTIGGTVVGVESGEGIIEKTQISVKHGKKRLEKRLQSILPFKKVSNRESFSGDIQINLGRDSRERLGDL